MLILSNRRGRMTFALCCAALVGLFLPWQTHISAPALMRPAHQTEIFPLSAAQIDHIYVQTEDHVSEGVLLMKLSSEDLTFKQSQSRERLKLLSAQMDRQASSLKQRRSIVTLEQEYAAEKMQLRAIETEIAQLNIYAPHDGLISELRAELHPGRYIQTSDRLMRLVSPIANNLIALPNDIEAARLSQDASFIFISDDPTAPKIKGQLTNLAPTSDPVISDILLTSIAGGPVAVNSDENGRLMAHSSVFKVQGLAATGIHLTRAQRGIVHIKASPQSPASALWRSIIRVLIRETDF